MPLYRLPAIVTPLGGIVNSDASAAGTQLVRHHG
jgi:hypothetical protein